MTVQLNEQLRQNLEALASQRGVSSAELIEQCLEEFVGGAQNGGSPWRLGEKLFGKFGSGRGDLSRNRKKIVREKIHAKRRAY